MNITKILDFLTGKKVQDYYNEYIKTQWFSSEAMRDYQLDKFKNLYLIVIPMCLITLN